jgi:hypothetical protein
LYDSYTKAIVTIHVLNFETPLPILPSNMPRPTHPASPVNRHAMSLSISNVSTNYEEGGSHIQAIVTSILHYLLHPLKLLNPHRFCLRAKLAKGILNLRFLGLVWQTTQTLPQFFFTSPKKNILNFLHFLYHINYFLLLFK